MHATHLPRLLFLGSARLNLGGWPLLVPLAILLSPLVLTVAALAPGLLDARPREGGRR